ncbi:hypothetical protein M099_1195 [Phocaeicola vulgatus str. 3975 RP4]|uniref:Uncharacterized protein n=2 Tax=Phocaeicola vulgatus TaxID=821 RepID=A0A078QKS2_PHOVU|nr:hypothetical protein M097_5013 [Phocaeicola vulgatus str. 3775 SL(B) 10 (iv)]KDS38733.1 hypothetical protein M098_3861 [Phocaeicola vulgatus str. 3775 SR(B) 19]KDS55894.1 hypothetical protein M099_1195 [Phocaeicola vulgatus str. 3975 RP4]
MHILIYLHCNIWNSMYHLMHSCKKEKEAKKAHQGLMRIPALTFN